VTSSSEQTTALDREVAVLHLWDEGIIRPESLGEQVIDALLAHGWRPAPRVVSTVAELDALPLGAVIRTPQEYTLERLTEGWYRAGVDYAYPLGNALMVPATVLWVGGTDV